MILLRYNVNAVNTPKNVLRKIRIHFDGDWVRVRATDQIMQSHLNQLMEWYQDYTAEEFNFETENHWDDFCKEMAYEMGAGDSYFRVINCICNCATSELFSYGCQCGVAWHIADMRKRYPDWREP